MGWSRPSRRPQCAPLGRFSFGSNSLLSAAALCGATCANPEDNSRSLAPTHQYLALTAVTHADIVPCCLQMGGGVMLLWKPLHTKGGHSDALGMALLLIGVMASSWSVL